MLCVKSFGDVDILDIVGNVNYVGYVGHLRQQESVVFKAAFIQSYSCHVKIRVLLFLCALLQS